jgi:hypothetical protein
MSAAAILCDSCFMPGHRTSRCGACKCVSYCSVECQKKTWKYHKHLCKAIVASTKNNNNNNDSTDDHSTTTFGLILDGMGPCGDKDINTKPLYQEMMSKHNMHVSIVHLNNDFITPTQISAALEKGNFATCIILGWGSGGEGEEEEYNTDIVFRTGLVNWVRKGGCLIVQGERISYAAGDWPQWFGLDWQSSDYCRTTHVLNTNHWFNMGGLSPALNVKACLVMNVKPEDVLYGAEDDAVTCSIVPGFGGRPVSSGQVAIALARCGAGTVSFYGDVNIEEETIAVIGLIAKYSVSASVV